MLFAIRDDDTNYFTKPEDLERIYSHIWGTCPISLAVTPFQAGVPEWLFPGCSAANLKEYPLEDNKELVSFLRHGCARGRLSIMLHGYNHNIASKQPEFWAGENLAVKVRQGKEYLESILDTSVTVFVPPHNSLSKQGLEAVRAAGLHIVGIQSFRPTLRVLRFHNIVPFIIRTFYLRVLREEYPRPLRVGGCWEIPYFTVGARTSPDLMIERITKAIPDRKSIFCLSTHHWEFECSIISNRKMKVIDMVSKAWELVAKTPGVSFVSVEGLVR